MTSPNLPNRASPSRSDPVYPDAEVLMALWDVLQGLGPRARLARVAEPWIEDGAHSLGAVQAGALRGLRAHFGDRIRCQDRCPNCALELGLDISATALLQAHEAAPDCAGALIWEDWRIRYRLPCVEDLHGLAADPEAARWQVLRACLRHVEGPGDDLPATVVERLEQRLELEDPLAAAEMALECPDCQTRWLTGFDACATFLAQIDAWARRTLREVHQLAMRYGWSQRELLQMSPLRREAYLLMDAP